MKRDEVREIASWLRREADELRLYSGVAEAIAKSDKLYAGAKFLESIAQAQPSAWEEPGYGWCIADRRRAIETDEMKASFSIPLYPLSLED